MVRRRGVARPEAHPISGALETVSITRSPIRFCAVKTDCCFADKTHSMANPTDRATCWSITINNPTPSDEEAIATARQKGWKIEGQIEKGAEGTTHYQLMCRTPQVRWSAVKKQFDRGHIEVARDPNALRKYVGKEESRVGELPSTEMYPSMSMLWRLIYRRNLTDDKEGWDYLAYTDDETIRMFRDHIAYQMEAHPLIWFDGQIRALIFEGYHVESLAVNPAVRSCWKNYWSSLLWRAHCEEIKCVKEDTTIEDAPEVQVPSLPPPQHPPCPDPLRHASGWSCPCSPHEHGNGN